jgi:hypothetical protein
MPIARSTILRGPAIVQFDGATFYTKGDIVANIDIETLEINASLYGKVDERLINRAGIVRFEPVGEWESLAVLFPYGSTLLGASMMGAVDKPLVIWTQDGKKITFAAACITRMPSIMLSAKKTLLGEVEFMTLGPDNKAWNDAVDKFVKIESIAFPASSFSSAAVITQPYVAAWGIAPWDSIKTVDGWTVDFDLSYDPLEVDTEGKIDLTLGSLGVSARATPLGITEQQLADALKIQDASAARGRSLNSVGTDLAITGTSVSVTLTKAALKAGGYAFGPTTPRIGELTWVATRTISGGVVSPLFVVA